MTACAALTTLAANGRTALTTAQLPSARAEVWQQWQQTTAAEASLPQLKPLSGRPLGQWTLPDSLEPQATMDFYFGTAGSCPTSGSGLPLMIYLHGSGPQDVEWANGLALSQRWGERSPALYWVPRIPNEGEWYRWWQRGKQWAYERLLRQVLASGEVHPDSIYMLGISEGGYGSQRLASFYADYLAAAGPMAGGEPLRNAPAENLRNLPLSFLTGDRDTGFYRNRLTARTARALDSLEQASPGFYTHRVQLLSGFGHGIPYELTAPWLKCFSRNSHPRRVTWEDYAMDGRHRSGFYNLLVEQRPELPDTVRILYNLTISGQTVDLTVEQVTYVTTEIDPMWGIALDFHRRISEAHGGSVTIFLDEELVDLERPVEVRLNGQTVFRGLLTLSEENLRRSCAAYFDPRRLYPAAVTLNY
jgi:hypothetical protein